MSPKINESPAANKNSSIPKEIPLRVWMSQKFIISCQIAAGHIRLRLRLDVHRHSDERTHALHPLISYVRTAENANAAKYSVRSTIQSVRGTCRTDPSPGRCARHSGSATFRLGLFPL